MKWTYTRIKSANCSKWTSGNNWVTKFDGSVVCVIGINGKRYGNFYFSDPKDARDEVEIILSRIANQGNES